MGGKNGKIRRRSSKEVNAKVEQEKEPKPPWMKAIKNPDEYRKEKEKQEQELRAHKERYIVAIEKRLERKLTFAERERLYKMSNSKL